MKHLFKKLSLIIFLVLCVFVIFSSVHTLNKQEEVPVAALPLVLYIPSIELIAPIEEVGRVAGAMASPLLAQDVGWYSYGVQPGEPGSAVIAGHVNWFGGKDAAFTKLKLLKIGDTFSVKDSYEEEITFIIREIKKYPVGSDTSEVFFSDDKGVHLNLITCAGLWNPDMETHESRLVIFSDQI